MNMHIKTKQILSPIVCLILSAPLLASAVTSDRGIQTGAMKIVTSDLDLSREEGISTLYNRLQKGASDVCGVRDTQVTGSRIASLKIKRQHRKCSTEALNNAVQSINNEMLSEFHRNKS